MYEIDLIREAYELDIFAVYGDDPYTIELILLTHAWMRETPAQERKSKHLWGFIERLKPRIPIPSDVTYRGRMQRLWKRGVVEGIHIGGIVKRKFDYVLTEYGDAVCKKHIDSLEEQIRLEKWQRRAR